MSKNWTPILNRTAGPLYLALADAIVEGILDGTLRPGARLPARRDLAYRLQVSINTVSNAYLEAERRGYVLGQVGSGTYVQAPKADSDIRAWHLGGRPAGLNHPLNGCVVVSLGRPDRGIRDDIHVITLFQRAQYRERHVDFAAPPRYDETSAAGRAYGCPKSAIVPGIVASAFQDLRGTDNTDEFWQEIAA